MVIFDIYSKRKKRLEKSGQPDVYIYDKFPEPLRVQIFQILQNTIGPNFLEEPFIKNFEPLPLSNIHWKMIHEIMCHELGVITLSDAQSIYQQCADFILAAPVDHVLDIIEVSFHIIDTNVHKMNDSERRKLEIKQTPDEAIEELNYRFREHGVGYQFVEGKVIRLDSEYIHEETVRPAISLLKHSKFEGAEDEFLKAHEHYRKGNYEDSIVNALKAFESTMKSICSSMKWNVPPNATAKPLIKACFDNGLIPNSLQSHFNALISTLEGLPTIRNKLAGHGQGQTPIDVPDYITAYALHLAATNIVFLVEAFLKLTK